MKTNNVIDQSLAAHIVSTAEHLTPPTEVAEGPPPPPGLASDLDELILLAAAGDSRAVGTLAKELGPTLLEIARSASGRKVDAEDVLQDFYVGLLEGRAAQFPPKRGQGLAWTEGLLKSLAQARRSELRRGVSHDDVVEHPYGALPTVRTGKRRRRF